jgi:hypothetical protein
LAKSSPLQKVKVCPESSGNELSEYILKILYVGCSPNGNGKRLATSLLEKHDIVFCLPSISQCEEGW